jgi:hypothetical protein
MDDASQEAQPFAGVFTVPPDILLGNRGVQREESFHASGLSENVCGVAELWRLDYNRLF